MSRTGIWGFENRLIPFWNIAYIKCPHCGRYYPVDKSVLGLKDKVTNLTLKCPFCRSEFKISEVTEVIE